MIRRVLFGLCGVFCVAYPIAVIGVTFDVRPPFSLAWAGSALLFLEGVLLVIAALLVYGWRRGLVAALCVALLSYAVEALGVGTGLPFGAYRYTDVLFPRLPGNVPLAVLFAWLMIVFGVYGWSKLRARDRSIGVSGVLLGALLAMLLDLTIEPVAFHLERYWVWLDPGSLNYYGVPLTNFVVWFIVAGALLYLIDSIFTRATFQSPSAPRLAHAAPRLLYAASLFMFGLVDLTHGYYGATVCAALAAGVLIIVSTFPRRAVASIVPAHRIEQDQAFEKDREGV